MPQELTDFEGVEVGDVLMVRQMVQTKDMLRPKLWRWFGVVEAKEKRHSVRVFRIGAPDTETRRFLSMKFIRDNESVQLLEPDEWPDGVHAFRAKMILTGLIDI